MSTMKFLDKEHNVGVLDLNEEVITDLKAKHPEPEPATDHSLLRGPIKYVPSHFFDAIDEQAVMKASLHTKGSAGPSGMDSDLYRRIPCSRNFNSAGKDLREEIETLSKDLATELRP